MKNNFTLVRTVCSILLVGLGFTIKAQKISSDYSTGTDFTKYKTYAWLAPGDSVLNRYRSEKLYGGFITLAANQELKSRGMKPDTLRPDAIFIFDTRVNEFTEYKQGATLSVGVGVAGPGYYVGGSAPVAGGKITASTAEAGKLTYAMYDAQTRKLVWTANAEQTFTMSDDIQKILGNATSKIFKKYPLKKSK